MNRVVVLVLILTGFGVFQLAILRMQQINNEICISGTSAEGQQYLAARRNALTDDEMLNSSAVAMDDPRLIQLIRTRFIELPSNRPYNFSDKASKKKGNNPSQGAVQVLENILKKMTDDPFYVECGANDGEWGSNSIWLERTLGWKGLLIEADALTFKRLRYKNRKAYSGQFCLATTPHPAIVNFFVDERGENAPRLGSGLRQSERRHALKPQPVQCFPLYSTLLAMNRTTVDFFTLDVESSELDVLLTVPFDKVIFKVITIEKIYVHQGEAALKQFMLDKGYRHYKDTKYDTIFVHPSLKL